MTYEEFCASKLIRAEAAGVTVSPDALHDALYPYQRAVTSWALGRGRSAVFADCGLGKTLMQLEWADRVRQHTGRPSLILTPLAVADQTVAEAAMIDVDALRCAGQSPVEMCSIAVTNYQRLHRFSPDAFGAIVLDESNAMVPSRSLANVEHVLVTARVARSGTATRSSGDMEGVFGPVTVAETARVRIVISQIVP